MGKKIKPGDRGFSATEFNRHVDASEFILRNFALGVPDGRRPSARELCFVTIKNDSGADRRQGDILEITDLALTDLTNRQLMLKGGSPTLANAFGVLQSPVKDAAFTRDFQIAGAGIAYVNVLDADDRYARVEASSYVLQSAPIGPVKILWKPTGTGEKVCAVRIGEAVSEILVKNQSGGDYAANSGPHDYHVYKGTPGSLTDTGQILSAYNIPQFKSSKMGAASLLYGVPYACPWEL